MYGLMGKIVAQPEKREALVNVLLRAATSLQTVDGCYLYVVSHDPNDEDGIWVTEVWDSSQAHRASLEHEAVQVLIGEGRPLIASMGERIEFEPVGGAGLPEQEQ
jgi:quinol monooxygenase YgiN